MYRPYPYYIKKEDAKDILKGQKTMLAIIISGMAIVFGVMIYFVLPKLALLYSDMGVALPVTTTYLVDYSLYIIGILLLLVVYILSPNNILNNGFEQKLSLYKKGEMIRTSNLINKNVELIIMLVLGLGMAFLVTTIIGPIYSITQSF